MGKQYRDSESGQYTTQEEALERPSETQSETYHRHDKENEMSDVEPESEPESEVVEGDEEDVPSEPVEPEDDPALEPEGAVGPEDLQQPVEVDDPAEEAEGTVHADDVAPPEDAQ